MITKDRLERSHQAAKMIEIDGTEAYHSVSHKFGSDIAAALLVVFIRRNHGSTDTYPPREGIVQKTNQVLDNFGLIE